MIQTEYYVPLVEFLGLYLGRECEIILCDTEKVLYIENAFDSLQAAGDPLSEIQQTLLQNPEPVHAPYTVNYRTLTASHEKLRSATLFLYEGQRLAGLLTINSKVTKLLKIREVLDELINGETASGSTSVKTTKSKPTEYYETLSLSVSEVIDNVIADSCETYHAIPERLTTDEKIQIIRVMDHKGIFLVKGSVSEVAKKLKSSDATIYRYLQQISK